MTGRRAWRRTTTSSRCTTGTCSRSWAADPGETSSDPACGTGGFLLAAHDYVVDHHPSMSRDQRHHLKYDALRQPSEDHYAVVLTNPPFGRKSGVQIINAAGEEERRTLTVVPPTSGRARRTSSSPSCSTWSPCRSRAGARPSPCRRTCSSRAARASLDPFLIRDEALEDTASLPEPDVIAREIVQDLRVALEESNHTHPHSLSYPAAIFR